jgi:hypothetical protein
MKISEEMRIKSKENSKERIKDLLLLIDKASNKGLYKILVPKESCSKEKKKILRTFGFRVKTKKEYEGYFKGYKKTNIIKIKW